MPKKNAHAMGEPLLSLTGRFPVSVVARIDAHAEAMRRAMPGLSIGRSDTLRILVMHALDALYGPTVNAVTDTVADTSPQIEDERVAIRAVRGVTDTVTDTTTTPTAKRKARSRQRAATATVAEPDAPQSSARRRKRQTAPAD